MSDPNIEEIQKAHKYSDLIQTEFDTDGHNVFDNEDSQIDGGITLSAALGVADEADKEIQQLIDRVHELEHDHGNALAVTEGVMADRDQLRQRVQELEEAHNGVNEYGVRVFVSRCKTCGAEFSVTPRPESLDDWQNCLGPDCGSYDESRDADKMFDDGIVERDLEVKTNE